MYRHVERSDEQFTTRIPVFISIMFGTGKGRDKCSRGDGTISAVSTNEGGNVSRAWLAAAT